MTTPSRWKLALKTLPFIAGVLCAKFAAHSFGWEFLSMNSLFTAIVSANIFLIGFLLSGVLSDYKESEKIPGDIFTCLLAMADEGLIIRKNVGSEDSKQYLLHLEHLADSLLKWFRKQERTKVVLQHILDLNTFFLIFEKQTQANFIVRLKQEQNTLRKLVTRVHTIRETSFLGTGYAIAEIITGILLFGLVFIKIDPFYESFFFVFFVGFIMIYMIFFIKDLDNPFGYDLENNLVEEVSLKPVLDARETLKSYCADIEKSL